MTVDEVLTAIRLAFPRFDDDAIASWATVFHHALRRFEGPALRDAHLVVLGKFRPTGRTPFPVPAEYLDALPDLRREMGKPEGVKLDLRAHGELVRGLVADWRLRQGNAFCRAVPAVLRAVADIASERANLVAWKDASAGPLLLSRDEMLIGLHRAVSIERRVRYGPLRERSAADVWWQQVGAILREWGFDDAWDDWQDVRFAAQRRLAPPLPADAQDELRL